MNFPYAIRKDPDISKLLSRLPNDTAMSLTDTQLRHLKVAIGSGQFRNHRVDIRGTFPLPFFPSRIYFVFLMGKNLRELSRQEKNIAIATVFVLLMVFVLLSTVIGLAVLYLLKSAAGINLFDGFSLGLWDWITQVFFH